MARKKLPPGTDKDPFYLTHSEQAIMEVLWASSEPLTSHDINELGEGTPLKWSDNTIYFNVNSLLNKGLIEVTNVTLCRKQYSRLFRPTIGKVEYYLKFIQHRLSKDEYNQLKARMEESKP